MKKQLALVLTFSLVSFLSIGIVIGDDSETANGIGNISLDQLSAFTSLVDVKQAVDSISQSTADADQETKELSDLVENKLDGLNLDDLLSPGPSPAPGPEPSDAVEFAPESEPSDAPVFAPGPGPSDVPISAPESEAGPGPAFAPESEMESIASPPAPVLGPELDYGDEDEGSPAPAPAPALGMDADDLF